MRTSAVGWLVTVVVILWSIPSLAQTHPCDQPSPTNIVIQSGAPHKASWCSLQVENIEALVAYVDNTPFDLVPVTPKSAPSASGKVLYESTYFIQVPRGAHQLSVALYNRTFEGTLQLGAATVIPFVANDANPVPLAPEIKGIVR